MMVLVPQAHADQAKLDATRARELFREALALEAAGDYASALGKLQQVASFKTTPQVSFNLGVCNEKLGKLVVALGHYRLALADAEQDPALKKVAAEATRALGELEPKIPTLTLKRGKGADTASVTVDGKEVSSTAIGSPMMLDPGVHSVEASADGYQNFKKQLRLDTSEKATLEIVMTPGASTPLVAGPKSSASAAPSTPTAPNASAASSESAGDAPPPASSSSPGSGMRTAGWIALGVGVIGGITSGVFYAKRSSAISDLNGMCGADKQSCPDSARATIDDGKSATLIGNVGLAVGAVGLVTGIILLASAGGGEEKPAAAPAPAARIRLIPASPGTWAGATIDARF